jgi:Ankyrin repeat
MDKGRAAELLALALAGDEARVRALLPPAGGLAGDDLPGTPGGATALMGAAAGGHEGVVALLLQCGADPSRRDLQGRSAAAYARAAGHPHLAERLDTVVDIEKTMW